MNRAKLAQAATEGMFTNTPTKSTKAGKTHKAAVKEGSGQQAKRDLVTYSVRIDMDVMKAWKTYTAIEKYGETGKLTEAALTEYMEKHKLTGDKLKKFNTLMEL